MVARYAVKETTAVSSLDRRAKMRGERLRWRCRGGGGGRADTGLQTANNIIECNIEQVELVFVYLPRAVAFAFAARWRRRRRRVFRERD
jgi:hypothetical protein